MNLKGLYQITTIIFLSFLALPSALAQVNDNTTIVNRTINGDVCGNTGHANVTCSGNNVPEFTDSRDVTNNQAIVEIGGNVTHTRYGGVFGGYTKGGGNVTGNIADIKGTTYNAYGGMQLNKIDGAGVVSRNAVIVRSGGIVDNNVYGGVGYSNDVNNNSVTIESGGTVNNDILVGHTNGLGNVSGNTADIRGKVIGSVHGGEIYLRQGGDVRDNKITVSGSVGRRVVGGYSTGSGTVAGNMVTIENSGAVGSDVQTAINEGNGNVVNNQADIKGGVTGSVWGGLAYGSGYVRGNTINVSGNVAANAIGGYSSNTGSGVISGNAVRVREIITITTLTEKMYTERHDFIIRNS